MLGMVLLRRVTYMLKIPWGQLEVGKSETREAIDQRLYSCRT